MRKNLLYLLIPLFVFVAVQDVFGLGTLFCRPRWSDQEYQKMWIKSVAVDIDIRDQIAVTHVDQIFKNELQFSDKNVNLKTENAAGVENVFSKDVQLKIVNLLYAMPHGVMAMSNAVEGLVETSTNMAIVETKDDHLELLTSQRSSVASAITDIADKVMALGELAGFEVEQGGGYPAWEPNPSSRLLALAQETYKDMYKADPEVKAIHAGLECCPRHG